MSKRKMNAATDPSPPSFGGYYKNARNVAGLKLQTAAEGLAAIGVAGVGVYGAVELDALWPLAVGGTVALLTAVHTLALRQHTQDVVADLWRHEMEAGRDLDGDGVVGRPTIQRSTRYINIGGEMEPFAEEEERETGPGIPVELVDGFDLTPRDLADLVEFAASRGLGKRQLVKLELPSGLRVTNGIWERFTQEAARRGWINSGGNGNGYTWKVKPESVTKAIRMATETGRPERQTGVPVPPAASYRSQTGRGVGEGRA